MESWWLGPCQVIQRRGDRSYRVQVKEKVIQDVHQDHLKPVRDALVTDPLFELNHYQGIYQDYDTAPDEFIVEKKVGHRWKADGTPEFRVRWREYDMSEDTWEPPSTFIMKYNTDFVEYCQAKHLTSKVNVLQHLHTQPQEQAL